jgi:hypothetical protein
MLPSPWSDAFSIPANPVELTWSMLHAPGLEGGNAAAAGVAEAATAAAVNVKTSALVVISFLLI